MRSFHVFILFMLVAMYSFAQERVLFASGDGLTISADMCIAS